MNPINSIYKKEVRFIGNIGNIENNGSSVIYSDGSSVTCSADNNGNSVHCGCAGNNY
jgi:hypothetical protein